MLAQQIKQKIAEAVHTLSSGTETDISADAISLTHPENPEFGDYATNVALQLSKSLKKPPGIIAQELATAIPIDETIEKVEVAGPGFINIYISKNYAIANLTQLAKNTITTLPFHFGLHKKAILEFAHPNTLKLFHIGHLRNITTGESLSRILEASGNTIIRANYQGDVGMHISKTLWKIKKMDEAGELDTIRQAAIREKIRTIGKAYAEGNAAFESDEQAKQEIIAINKQVYAEDPAIMPLWKETRQWSLDYFDEVYAKVGTKYDAFYFESDQAKRGIELSREALEKGILIEDQGAVIFPGEKYGLDRRVFINSLGLPTYEGKELALAEKEFSDHGDIDKLIHVVAGEQVSFMKVTFKVQELMGIQKDQQYHQIYGWVDIKGAKMSSRKGNVVEGEWLLNEAKKQILETYEKSDEATAEKLAVAAVKYAFLKNAILTRVEFDIGESVNLNGNSGPYLLYTYVRTQSILKKADDFNHEAELDSQSVNTIIQTIATEESAILRYLNQYPEIVYQAASTLSPNVIATYLFELAQQFNFFYQKQPILKADPAQKQFRLLVTTAVGNILKHGLHLLGIEPVESM